MATLKHFVHGTPEGGRNIAPARLGPRELRELYFPPFAAAIRAGAGSIMASYNEIDGIPCSASHQLLNDALRKELGFAGFVTSDWEAIRWLSEIHRVAPDLEAAAGAALAAGIDMEMQGSRDGGAYAAPLLAAAAAGRIPITLIDAAAERILAAKFELGLFEQPYAAPARAAEVVRCPAHRELAREAARRSIVLLKNDGEMLPLPATLRRIAVIGPNADNVANQLGDYTGRQDRRAIATALDGVRAAWPQAEVAYAEGCRVREANSDLRDAVEAAQRAEVAILVLGGSSAQGFTGETPVAADVVEAVPETNPDRDCGEHYDRVDLELSGSQMALVDAVAATGTPIVVALIQGRPSAIPTLAARVPAILCAWYPGEQGGHALADVLSGRAAPAGRLPVSVPRSAGQLPCFYNHKPSSPSIRGRYVESAFEPLYPFGYGLTYTTFKYADPRALPERIGLDGQIQASVAVTNTGVRAGEAVAQFYIRDEYASVTRPVKQLAGWARVALAPGETRRVAVTIDAAHLSFIGEDLRRQIEPGHFRLMAGVDSQTLISTTFEVVA
jgi:beta-glucosidase